MRHLDYDYFQDAEICLNCHFYNEYDIDTIPTYSMIKDFEGYCDNSKSAIFGCGKHHFLMIIVVILFII